MRTILLACEYCTKWAIMTSYYRTNSCCPASPRVHCPYVLHTRMTILGRHPISYMNNRTHLHISDRRRECSKDYVRHLCAPHYYMHSIECGASTRVNSGETILALRRTFGVRSQDAELTYPCRASNQESCFAK